MSNYLLEKYKVLTKIEKRYNNMVSDIITNMSLSYNTNNSTLHRCVRIHIDNSSILLMFIKHTRLPNLVTSELIKLDHTLFPEQMNEIEEYVKILVVLNNELKSLRKNINLKYLGSIMTNASGNTVIVKAVKFTAIEVVLGTEYVFFNDSDAIINYKEYKLCKH